MAYERLARAVDRTGRPAWRLRLRDPRGRTFHGLATADAIVQLRPGVDASRAFVSLGLAPVRPLFAATGAWLVRDAAGAGDGVDVAVRLAGDARLVSAVPDLAVEHAAAQMRVPPDDPRYGGQWYLARLSIESAWRRHAGSASTAIAVVDNGCEAGHPDLRANLGPGRDVLDGDDDPQFTPGVRGNNHGTACAGVAAGVGDNATGIAGVCPRCTARCVRLLGRRGELIPISADVEAFAWAHEQGVAVVSNSWGFVEAMAVPAPLAAAMEAVFDEGRGGLGAVVVFAAGNENREVGDDEIYGVRGVITVGAVTHFDDAASFSNRGAPVDLAAPAGTVTTDLSGAEGDDPGDYTALFGGTSAAAPVVSGVAGLLISLRPGLTAREVHEVLLRTARPAPYARPDVRGHDANYGYGIVDPVAAMRAVAPVAEDAGAPVDAAAEPNTGCACAVAARPGRSLWWWALLAALALRPRPRRARP